MWCFQKPGLLLFCTILSSLVLMGVGSSCMENQRTEPAEQEEAIRCGECLEQQPGEVCTEAGTRRNSCYAICE
ncbi:MAG: hypothetical protein KDK27_07315, partial [Leptospiraceae bacterium]|nr:hypothetical protein [Leptospiraceae bacterium]